MLTVAAVAETVVVVRAAVGDAEDVVVKHNWALVET